MDSQSEERDQIFNIWAKEVSVLFRDIYVWQSFSVALCHSQSIPSMPVSIFTKFNISAQVSL
jgi:hypothetical protein